MTEYTPGPWVFCEEDLTIRVREWGRCPLMGDYRGCIIADLKPSLGLSADSPAGVALARKVRAHCVPELLANAHRIVAAVAACQDVATELLAPGCLVQVAEDARDLLLQALKARAQRDALLAACKAALPELEATLEAYPDITAHDGGSLAGAIKQVRAAIASVKEGQSS